MTEGKVIDFAAAKEAREPHVSGECFCLSCGHQWVQVERATAEGITWIKCPDCRRETGRYRYQFAKTDASYWECACGNELFKLYKGTGVAFCPSCGGEKPLVEVIDGVV